MSNLKVYLVLGLALFVGATASASATASNAENAHKNSTTSEPEGVLIDVRDTPADFKLPGKLWDTLVLASPGGKDGGHGSGAGAKEEKTDVLIVWLPVEVSLNAKSEGILVHDSVQYNLPRGGGTLDLSKVTAGDRGTFYIKFNLVEFSNPSALKVYFISNAKKRRVDGEVFGAGCNVYFDITKAFQKENNSEGLKFNITNNRHISAMSGHFIFVQTEKDKVYLSQVEFNDSKNRDYLCRI